MLNQNFTTKAYKITTGANGFGERTILTSPEIYIRFREILGTERSNKMEAPNCDAMAWAKPGDNLNKNDIIKVNDVCYKVEKATYAKKLGSEIVQFIKCELNVYKELP